MPRWAIALGLLAGLFVVGLAGLWASHSLSSRLQGASMGALLAVTLVNGQIYYGTLEETSPHMLTLANVYYVTGAAQGANGQRDNQLVNRRVNDWHGPLSMTIPLDKVLFFETVGRDSRLAQLVMEDKKRQPALAR